ncbi:unnamed protein product, partial [Ectocarpus sp. 12 AP-2014]
ATLPPSSLRISAACARCPDGEPNKKKTRDWYTSPGYYCTPQQHHVSGVFRTRGR